jgi:hypothetical protein
MQTTPASSFLARRRAHHTVTWASPCQCCTLHTHRMRCNHKWPAATLLPRLAIRCCRITCNPSPSNSAGCVSMVMHERERREWERAVKTHIQGILTQDISKQMEYCSAVRGRAIAVNVRRQRDTGAALGWNVSVPIWGNLSSHPPAHHHYPPKGTCASVSSSRYIYDPLLPALHKIFLQIFFYIYALIRMDVNKHMHISRERERAYREAKRNKRWDLIPCGKREEIFACVCKALDYHWNLWLCCELSPCVQQRNLLSPLVLPAAACSPHIPPLQGMQ